MPTRWDAINGETPTYQRHLALAMRCIVATLADPDTPFSYEHVAAATGLKVETVIEALSSEECKEILRENCMRECALALNKGVRVAQTIMLQSKSESTRLEAMRALTNLYRTMANLTDKRKDTVSEQDIEKFLSQLQRAEYQVGKPPKED